MRRVVTFLALVGLALAGPAGAQAKSIAPPGQSEADQYFETVPAPAGPRSPDGSKREADAVSDGSLSAATGRALARRGPQGQALATAVARTAAASRGAGREGGAAPGRSHSPSAAPAAAPGSAGLGVLFPLALVATALAAVAFAVARSRRPAAGRRPATR